MSAPKQVKNEYFLPVWGHLGTKKTVNLGSFKSGLRYYNQNFTIFGSHKNPTFHQIWRSLLHSKRISLQNHFKLLKGVAGLFFELLPPNLMKRHIYGICTNGEIIIFIALEVSDLAKVSLSQMSIS